MNKLVSKSSVLRFKLGKKIEKLQNGRYIVTRPDGFQYTSNSVNGRFGSWGEAFNSSAQAEYNRKVDQGLIDANAWKDSWQKMGRTYKTYPGGDWMAKYKDKIIYNPSRSWYSSDMFKIEHPDIINRIRKGNSQQKPQLELKELLKKTNVPQTLETPLTKQVQSAPTIGFKQAFRLARLAGLKEFTWNGKRYNTKTKNDVLKEKVKFVPVNPMEDDGPVYNRNSAWRGEILKNGGSLISSNPIKRFKQRK